MTACPLGARDCNVLGGTTLFDDLHIYLCGRFKETVLMENNPGGIRVTSGELRCDGVGQNNSIASLRVLSALKGRIQTVKRASHNASI